MKIMCHQNAGATQGIDAGSILKKYGLSINDWAQVGAHWGGKMMTDMSLAMKMGPLMQKFAAEFSKPGAAGDLEF
jgi:hypothetical protein